MKKPKTKMPVSQRAKQFAPFAAITGLEVALRKKELEHEQKINSQVEYIINVDDGNFDEKTV